MADSKMANSSYLPLPLPIRNAPPEKDFPLLFGRSFASCGCDFPETSGREIIEMCRGFRFYDDQHDHRNITRGMAHLLKLYPFLLIYLIPYGWEGEYEGFIRNIRDQDWVDLLRQLDQVILYERLQGPFIERIQKAWRKCRYNPEYKMCEICQAKHMEEVCRNFSHNLS